MKKLFLVLSLLLGLITSYLLCWPVPIEPKAWDPPPAPDMTRGVFQENTRLASLKMIPIDHLGEGPEDIIVDSAGNVFTGLVNGKILKFPAATMEPEVFADTEGRPLGLEFDAAGNLIVADARKGLLSVSPAGEITILTDGLNGVPFLFTDDLDIAADGKIYFSDASTIASVGNFKDDLLEHDAKGRLLMYDPATGKTEMLLDQLYFANGIALGPDDAYVLINETSAYRIRKYWLKGPKKGQDEMWIENLPGFPDNLYFNEKDIVWVGIVNPRNKLLDRLLPYPSLRKIVKRLPEAVQPKEVRSSILLGLDLNAHVVHNLQDPSARYSSITGAREYNGRLYLSSLIEIAIAYIAHP